MRSKSKRLTVADWTIRETRKEDADDTGWRFQAVLRNECSSPLKNIEAELRYFDSSGKFLGVDEWISMTIFDELGAKEDKAVSISLNVPPGTSRALFSVKGRATSVLDVLEKHGFLLFGVAILVAAVLHFLKR